jgi:hypothetical protein
MSGPATAAFSFGPFGAIAVAALALREARQMGREYQDVQHEVQRRAADLADAQRAARTARCEQLQATRQGVATLETQLERLRRLATALGLPQERVLSLLAPVTAQPAAEGSPDAWQRRLQALQTAATALQQAIDAAHTERAAATPGPDLGLGLGVGELPPLEEALHAYMVQRALLTQLNARQAEPLRQLVARLLARLELAPGEPIPADLDGLAQTIALAPTLERAEALALELRLRIQQHAEQRAAHMAEAAEARALLEALGDDLSDSLRLGLQAVLLGERLLPQTRALAEQALQAQAMQRRQEEEAAAAEVLAQSLRDLGYEVDGVQDTFFVEGGVAHIQRHGWGEYFVRLRANVAEQTLNFNVVRAHGAPETPERRRQDTLAEDRWCREFPKLLETLAARGLRLDVQRLLGAGELPVQTVDPASLPTLHTEQRSPARASLRELKP